MFWYICIFVYLYYFYVFIVTAIIVMCATWLLNVNSLMVP